MSRDPSRYGLFGTQAGRKDHSLPPPLTSGGESGRKLVPERARGAEQPRVIGIFMRGGKGPQLSASFDNSAVSNPASGVRVAVVCSGRPIWGGVQICNKAP